jgi:hypothetical protein
LLPFPESVTSADPESELSETISDPVRLPPVTGVKVTLIVQLAAGLRFPGQLSVCEKSPTALTLETTMLALPVLVNRTACAELEVPTVCSAKVKELTDKVFAGAPAVPLRESVCGLLGAESVTMIVPILLPVEVGVNVTTTVQVPTLAASVAQLLVWAKSPFA